MTKFLTIRQVASTGILTEHRLRLMEKQGQLPCIRAGNRVLINVEALADQLDTESRKGVRAND